MTSRKLSIIFFLLLTALPVLYAQTNPVEKGLAAITKEAVEGQLEFLSSDWTEGREATTKGEFMSADYIASMFKFYGLKPAGDNILPQFSGRRPSGQQAQRPQLQPTRSFFQNIPFVSVEPGSGEQSLALIEKEGATEKKYFFSPSDFSVLVAGIGVEFTAPVVFVGYGFKSDVLGYDDFKGIDVKGKIIVRLSGLPGAADPNSEAYKKLNLADRQNMMALSRGKNEIAEKLGAIAVIEINTSGAAGMRGRAMGNQYANFPIRFNTATYEGDLPLRSGSVRVSLPNDNLNLGINTLNVNQKISALLLQDSGINIAEFEKNVTAKLKPASKELKGKYLYVKTSVPKTKTLLGRNVVGMIEGENPNEVIVVGGHYDHMGMANGYVWNGADDNASGTVGVMTIAKAIMATGVKPKKTIIFAAWTGEEKGLLGSKYFVEKFQPVENIKLNLNYDMIARNVDADKDGVQVGIQYSEKYPILKTVVEKANETYKLGLKTEFRASLRPTGGIGLCLFLR